MANTHTVSASVPGQHVHTINFDTNASSVVIDDCATADSITVQVEGTFGGGTVAVQGSNDNATYYALPTATSRATAGLMAVASADLGYRYYQLALTGAVAPDIDCTVVVTRRAAGPFVR